MNSASRSTLPSTRPFARALAVSPDERFRTAGDFAEALAAALEASPDATGKPATVSEAPAPAFAANLVAADFEQPGPTSTSAVILAPSSPPDPDGSSRASEPFAAVDVPPPPAQMGAVLAAYETAAPHRFPMESSAQLSTDTEAPVVPCVLNPSEPPPGDGRRSFGSPGLLLER